MRARALLISALAVSTTLAACGPVSPRRAAEQCEERARAAQGVQGRVGVGIGSRGVSSDLELSVTSDALRGRAPYVVYDQCVRAKTGQGPIRPLAL